MTEAGTHQYGLIAMDVILETRLRRQQIDRDAIFVARSLKQEITMVATLAMDMRKTNRTGLQAEGRIVMLAWEITRSVEVHPQIATTIVHRPRITAVTIVTTTVAITAMTGPKYHPIPILVIATMSSPPMLQQDHAVDAMVLVLHMCRVKCSSHRNHRDRYHRDRTLVREGSISHLRPSLQVPEVSLVT